MKLYTEKEILRTFGFGLNEMTFKGFMNAIKPIKLPSDAEIEEKINCDIHIESDADFFNGAQWMRDKLTHQNERL